ncbi:MAG TPA: right-handed parallel beta-helix repeat-containing protein, partial [Dehalococcoidia bacterium]|nr:right-handed parallel beta-helix repeat-containing protein [Dehalococcoidia bacterium]
TGTSTTGNLLIGNLIGTDAGGTLDRGNTLDGIRIDGGADSTGMGNGVAGGGNVISGNGQNGINITGDGSMDAEIWGNMIGTNAAGTAAVANSESGILIWGAVNTSIGGNIAAKRNVISGNGSSGVFILPQVTGYGATGNTLQGNYVGTAADGVTPLGNSGNGILLFFAPSNTIGGTGAGDGNTIAFNGGNGVGVDRPEASGNLIQRNSIHSNGLLGIDLTNGANGGLLPPTILSFNPPAKEVVGETCAFCTVEVFSDSADEGRLYQGVTSADSLGDWVVSAPFLGPNITATTTSGGNTSEFSAPFACPDSDGDTVCDAGDNCPAVANPTQSNADGDAFGDHCDSSDTDGDGFTDETEARYVGTNAGYPCGGNSWPADLWDQPPFSANKITVQDLTSFLAPVYRMNTSPGDANFSARWDILPGRGLFAKNINVQDLTLLITLTPPMLNGARALNGPTCPYPAQ